MTDDHVTIDGKSVIDFLDKKKSKEISIDYKTSVIRSTVDNKTRRDSYFTSRRAASRPLFDKSQKNGEVKHYKRSEVKRMNLLNELSENERLIFNIIYDSGRPMTFSKMKKTFVEQNPGVLSPKSTQSFQKAVDNLAEIGLIKKLTRHGMGFVPHRFKTDQYLQALSDAELAELSILPQGVGEGKELNQAESKPTAVVNETTVESKTEIHDTISAWMDANNIVEFTISIKKGGA